MCNAQELETQSSPGRLHGVAKPWVDRPAVGRIFEVVDALLHSWESEAQDIRSICNYNCILWLSSKPLYLASLLPRTNGEPTVQLNSLCHPELPVPITRTNLQTDMPHPRVLRHIVIASNSRDKKFRSQDAGAPLCEACSAEAGIPRNF